MDILNYLEDYRVIVSLPCATGIAPQHLTTYLWSRHRHTHGHFSSRPAAE